MTMGARLKELRKQNGLSQTDVGEKIGVSLNTMSRIESDKSDIPGEALKKASELFQVSSDYLLFGTECKRTISENEQEILEALRKDEDMTNAVLEVAKLKKKAINYLRSYKLSRQHAAMS